MKVLIVEDEKLATQHLEGLLSKVGEEIEVVGRADSVKNGIKWILTNPAPELCMMDIDLGDGLCFEIFDVVDFQIPIIFTTAYDEYAIKAFKVNSIDYLLKPIDLPNLQQAIEKFRKISPSVRLPTRETYVSTGQLLTKGYKERVVIKVGEHLVTLRVRDTLYYYSQDKATFACSLEPRKYLIDFTLDRLEGILDPAHFFRINRKYIINVDAIADIISYSNSRLRIVLRHSDDNDVVVSRDRVSDFKQWLDR